MPRKGEKEKANAEIEKKAKGKKDHLETAKAVSNRSFQTEADVCTRLEDCSRLQPNQEKEGRNERKEDNATRKIEKKAAEEKGKWRNKKDLPPEELGGWDIKKQRQGPTYTGGDFKAGFEPDWPGKEVVLDRTCLTKNSA